MTRRGGAEIGSEMALRLMSGPATLAQLCGVLGIPTRHSDNAKGYLVAFKARGLVRIADWQRGCWAMYQWQSAPFALPDVPRPVKAKKAKPAAVIAMPARPSSAFTWGQQA